MMNTVMLHRAALLSAAGSILLAGCAAPKPMYQWEGYQTQVYEYFKGESREAQITALESGLQKIQAQSGSVPPGYHAQLGLLYLNVGKGEQMIKEFQTEKTLFPESAPYMDFLLRNVKGDTRTEISTGATAGKAAGSASTAGSAQ
ncbi:DUF4810 domain-containing protein [Cupriavidus taiwanensis]|uniref:Putative lipoprotein n=1 Tax=Cupriavidus taiwanensis TaxID=164546 RepID=A0A375IPW5_9BURK|nr:DUF4810 domain-containing protein [Cupriavidus taiwanensis]SOZ29558.1 putative lipoprotein [Cupriavidus taiwanensis]SPA34393.1 putative lipoprotein [Cupriavidus taiwanensis]SPA52099.1 putative lipoprotein [Cupriavidus taiwanensis]SPK76158.1 putative lipoprotein [Cupriavidus taiwanensis]